MTLWRSLLAALIAIAIGLWVMRPALPPDAPVALSDTAKIDTLVVFGTSLSQAPRYDWPDALGRALEACMGHTLHVLRVTKAGANSDWGLQNIDNVSHAKPDLVLIEFAINDADLTDGLSLSRSHENHATILQTLQSRLPDAQFLLMTTNPVSGLHRLKRYRLGQYYSLYTGLTQQFGTGLIHMHPHWKGIELPDGVHPENKDATAVMVPHLTRIITNNRCTSSG